MEVDASLETLAARASAWASMPPVHKVDLLRAVRQAVYSTAPQWVEAAARAKGLRCESPLIGEEWISGPWAVLYALTRYLRTLASLADCGYPKIPRMHTEGGRTVVDVFPQDAYDRLLLSGIRAQVWMRAGITPRQTRERAASFYRQRNPAGSVALILGAGNIASIAPLDVLYHLIARGAVCIVKLNPVNDYLGPIFERAFGPLVEAGFLRFAYGGAEMGAYLCSHRLVTRIHVTGSEQTYRAIVSSIAQGKPVTSELGNVTPTIVLPGPWTRRDLDFQAENIATQKAHNAGFNCIAAQVLIVPKEWKQTPDLLMRVDRILKQSEARPEYYPGAAQRRAGLGATDQPRALISIDASLRDHTAFRDEAFCGVLTGVELPGNLQQYVREAATFANERLHGTLGANLIVHPETMRRHRALIDTLVSELRYGCVAVNTWTGVGYFLTETPWGAFPGHTPSEIGSGIGVVHNSYLLEDTEKTVIHGPFAPFPRSFLAGECSLLPRPPWFITNLMAAEIGRALCDFEIARTPAKALRVAALALHG